MESTSVPLSPFRTQNGGGSWISQTMTPTVFGGVTDITFISVPEPSALMLGGAALVPMLMRRRTREAE